MKTIEQLLSELPPTMDAIAQFMVEHGHLGRNGVHHRNAYDCPLAQYLRANGHPDADVGYTLCQEGDGPPYSTLPHICQMFIIAVDDGRYQHLGLN